MTTTMWACPGYRVREVILTLSGHNYPARLLSGSRVPGSVVDETLRLPPRAAHHDDSVGYCLYVRHTTSGVQMESNLRDQLGASLGFMIDRAST